MTLKDFQLAKKYFVLTNTKKKKKACKLCFEKLQILIDGYKFLVNNVDSNLRRITQKNMKFIDDIIPKHLQQELFVGLEKEIQNLKTQFEKAKIMAQNIVADRTESGFYKKKYYMTMKGKYCAILKEYNRKDEKRMIFKNKKQVFFIGSIPIILKMNSKTQKVFVSKTYGSESYTDYEIDFMEQQMQK